MNGYYENVTALLKKNGFERIRGHGTSHETWNNTARNRPVTVSKNLLSRHTANAILKDAGVSIKL